jgi:hypothetical protein
MRLFWTTCTVLLWTLLAPAAAAQTYGEVRGTVTDASDGTPLPGVTVVVNGTNFGTATDADGAYERRLPAGRYALRFSSVGYETVVDSVVIRDDETTRLDVALTPSVVEMDELTVEDEEGAQDAGVYKVDPQDVQNIPTPFKDGFRALKVMPGVATNNELSQQFSVRGGGYNENLIFLNGFEVWMPFRPRQGEQEGLGLLNPDLANDITFYTGGFPARFGGKLSSALQVSYDQPQDQTLKGSASASMMDASLHAQGATADGDLSWNVGVRGAQPGRFFGTQDLKGDYDPRFLDVQGMFTYRLSDRTSLEALGIWADHQFDLEPTQRQTFFGIISLNPEVPSNFKSLWTSLNGARSDGYTTAFSGLRLNTALSDRFRMEHDVAVFDTKETENFNIEGDARVSQVDPSSDPGSSDGQQVLSRSDHLNFADNSVTVQRWTAKGRYNLNVERHALEAGWSARSLSFTDEINEKSVIWTQRTIDGQRQRVRIVGDSLNDTARFDETQGAFYVQDAVDVLPERNRLIVTGGVRGDYYSFNDDLTISPRLNARFRYDDQLTLTGSWGIYYQKPSYRELRGTPDGGQSISNALNRDLESQQSMQFVLGGEYFLPQKRLWLRAEAYYKDLDNIISYRIDDVRVEYSGENDARGFTYGFDLQLRGEFVPGLESWFNYSFMVARERFKEPFQTQYNQGLVPRPTDQRHTFSAFVQDYVPGDKTWKMHLRLLYGSGLPYTPPVPGPETAGGQRVRVPGPRMSARLPAYRRVDLGVTKEVDLVDSGIASRPVTLDLTLEVLNVFDMDNTVTYTWEGDWTRVPKRLTPRTLNARARLTF